MNKPRFKYVGGLRRVEDIQLAIRVFNSEPTNCRELDYENGTVVFVSADRQAVWVRAPLGKSLLCLVRV